MTVENFLNEYDGFNYDGEIVLVDTKTGKAYICTYDGYSLNHPFHKWEDWHCKKVRSWNHTEKTMVITI